MATIIKPALSEKNKYWIEKHRYYELKHFCLQYPDWKKTCIALDGFSKRNLDTPIVVNTNLHGDPTIKCVLAKSYYSERISMIERVAVQTDQDLANYILKAVTEELSYEYLKTNMNIPCCRDTYYDRYRKFFWLLNKERG